MPEDLSLISENMALIYHKTISDTVLIHVLLPSVKGLHIYTKLYEIILPEYVISLQPPPQPPYKEMVLKNSLTLQLIFKGLMTGSSHLY